MKLADNRIISVVEQFRKELVPIYGETETESLIAESFYHISNIQRSELRLKHNDFLNESTLLKYLDVLKQLRNNKPLQYIFGKAHFYGMDFYVNENVLIPRPETEELVHNIIKLHKDKSPVIIDIGTGSGCIAITLKKNIPRAKVYGIDISEAALQTAKKNAVKNLTEVEFVQHDILNETAEIPLPELDIVVSNPPYITEAEKEVMHPNVLTWEPHLALFTTEADALHFYRKINRFAMKKLRTGGELWYEINEFMAEEMLNLMKNDKFTEVEILHDLSGKSRMLKAVKPLK